MVKYFYTIRKEGSDLQQFFQKLRFGLIRFMQGRYGPARLSLFLIWASLILNIISVLAGHYAISVLFNFLSTAGWVWSIFRILSKNKSARYAENAWFLKHWAQVKTPVMQAVTRFKNRKKYVYFTCPECHMKLRLPRGVGNVTVRCSKCGHSFEKKA